MSVLRKPLKLSAIGRGMARTAGFTPKLLPYKVPTPQFIIEALQKIMPVLEAPDRVLGIPEPAIRPSFPKHTIRLRISDIRGNEQVRSFHVGILSIGRSKLCDLVLDDPGVSKEHAQIEIIDGNPFVRDLDSTNGVFLNGVAVQYPGVDVYIEPGSKIIIGRCSIIIESVDGKRHVDDEKPEPSGVLEIKDMKTAAGICRRFSFEGEPNDFFSRLDLMEKAIRILPDKTAEKGIEIWSRWLCFELEKHSNVSPPQRLVEYELILNAMDCLVGKACQTTEIFDLINKNPRIIEFGLVAKRFGGRKNFSVNAIKSDRKLRKALKRKKIQRFDDVRAALKEVLGSVTDDVMSQQGVDREKLWSDLEGPHDVRGAALATLNHVINKLGVYVEVSNGKVVLAQVTHIASSNEGQCIFLVPMKGFPDLFEDEDGYRYLGYYHPNTKLIVLKREKMLGMLGDSISTQHHEIQHYLDDLVGYRDFLRRTYADDDERRGYTEATAIAAQHLYSEHTGSQVRTDIRKRKRMRGNHSRYARAAGILEKHLDEYYSSNPDSPIEVALRSYLNKEYERAIGVTYVALFARNGRLNPAEIVAQTTGIRLPVSDEHTILFNGD